MSGLLRGYGKIVRGHHPLLAPACKQEMNGRRPRRRSCPRARRSSRRAL